MNFMTILGFVAGVFTGIASLPQVIKVWKRKSAKDIAFVMVLFYSAGNALWIIYSFSRKDWPVLINSSFALIINLILGGLKLKYK